jgi:uncharacterized protein (DUF1330 family)
VAKGYWVVCYRSISKPAAMAEYAKLARPAIESAGGRFLALGPAAKAYEAAKDGPVVVIEFESLAKAIAAYESDAYQEALKPLAGAAERDLRIVEGIA